MRQILIKLKKAFLDLLFPAFCIGCKAEGNFLCLVCQKTIPRLEKQVCPWCYKESTRELDCDVDSHGIGFFKVNGSSCDLCSSEVNQVIQKHLDAIVAFCRFEERSLIQRAIHQLKYEFIEELSEPLGKMLFEVFCDVVKNNPDAHFIFCPLPLHPQREKWRGFNQSEKICASLIDLLHKHGLQNIEMYQLLERVHFSKPQMELEREERVKNVADAFRLKKGCSFEKIQSVNKTQQIIIVLVDDIATTLSTLNSAAGALKSSNFKRVYGLVLARVF